MAKPPRIRHSKSRKEPVTIDLGPEEVRRVEEEAAAGEAGSPSEEQIASTVPDESATTGTGEEDMSDQPDGTPDAAGEPERKQETNLFDAVPETGDADEAGASNGHEFGRPAEPMPAPERSGGAGRAAVAGGLIGAALALAGAAALQWSGMLPATRGADATGASLQVLRGEIDVLRQEIAEARRSAGAEAAAQAETRLTELSGAVEGLRTQLQDLQAASAQGEGADGAEAAQALTGRIAQLESTVAALPKAGGDIAGLEQRLASMEEALRVAAQDRAANASQAAQLEQRMAELSRQVEEQAAEPGMMLAVAATALKSAIDRGTPFMTELETYAAVAPESEEIAALRDLAASGVPTHEQIMAELPDAADRMVAATRPADPDAGFLDQLWSSARSLVQVRPVGEVEGESPEAAVARMEVALRQGDYEKALQEFDSLPEAAKAAGKDFVERVRARQTADQLIARALSGATRVPGSEG